MHGLVNRPQVSTRSRPKAAGLQHRCFVLLLMCFNTQPPEGGWFRLTRLKIYIRSFNTQPPEGGWHLSRTHTYIEEKFQHAAARRRLGRYLPMPKKWTTVSTRSRPKAAGATKHHTLHSKTVSTRSRPKAAGIVLGCVLKSSSVSTRSRPKAAGKRMVNINFDKLVSTRSRPKAAGSVPVFRSLISYRFQHAAARRRLDKLALVYSSLNHVSTRSRPKAAG